MNTTNITFSSSRGNLGNQNRFCGITISETVERLKQIFGKPDSVNNDGKSNINFYWDLRVEFEGQIIEFYFYSWKEGRILSENAYVDWHISGRNLEEAETVKKAITLALANIK